MSEGELSNITGPRRLEEKKPFHVKQSSNWRELPSYKNWIGSELETIWIAKQWPSRKRGPLSRLGAFAFQMK